MSFEFRINFFKERTWNDENAPEAKIEWPKESTPTTCITLNSYETLKINGFKLLESHSMKNAWEDLDPNFTVVVVLEREARERGG